jgi:hypothetical protein
MTHAEWIVLHVDGMTSRKRLDKCPCRHGEETSLKHWRIGKEGLRPVIGPMRYGVMWIAAHIDSERGGPRKCSKNEKCKVAGGVGGRIRNAQAWAITELALHSRIIFAEWNVLCVPFKSSQTNQNRQIRRELWEKNINVNMLHIFLGLSVLAILLFSFALHSIPRSSIFWSLEVSKMYKRFSSRTAHQNF